MARPATPVTLSDAERRQLEQWVAAHGTPQQVALRCRIVLAAAAERNNVAIGEELGVDVKTVALWRRRFAEARAQGLWHVAAGLNDLRDLGCRDGKTNAFAVRIRQIHAQHQAKPTFIRRLRNAGLLDRA